MKSTTSHVHDVAVVGGGPAGLHAAALLSARGFRVILFEEHHEIGEPVHCTGLVAAETYEQFDLPADSVLNRLRTVRFYPPSGQVFEYTSDRDEPLVVNRALFDRRLAERARERGVEMRVGVKIREVSLEEHGVVIRQADGEVARARACVLACGANYSLHRRLGLEMPRVFLQSAQAEMAAGWHSVVEIHFGDRVAPRGFAWAVPVNWPGEPRLRVGLMCETDAGAHFQRFLADILRRRGDRSIAGPKAGAARGDRGAGLRSCARTSDIEHANRGAALRSRDGADPRLVAPRLKMLPLAPLSRTYGHRLVAIGDAAGLVKATTGGGVYYGLVSATIAADMLAAALTRDELGERSLSRYQCGWRKRLGAELDAQMALRTVVQDLSDDQIEGLFDLARHDGVMPIVRRTARFNEHRELIVSLLKHPPVRQLLYRGLADRTRRFVAGAAPRWFGAGPVACAAGYLAGPATTPHGGCQDGGPARPGQRACGVARFGDAPDCGWPDRDDAGDRR